MSKYYQHLSSTERAVIQVQLEIGLKPAAIARGLNRSVSTVSRELRRNGWKRPQSKRGRGRPTVAGGYRAEAADKRAQICAKTPRVQRRLRPGTVLWDCVVHYLQACYSPEQIAGTLARTHPDTPQMQISHETIYTAIYAMPRGELRSQPITARRLLAGCALATTSAVLVHAAKIGGGRFPRWSASMIARRKLRSAWCRGIGRVT
jgi:IS30 family transposase